MRRKASCRAAGKESLLSVCYDQNKANSIKEWERDESVRLSGRLLPVPTNQRMNAYLKEIALLCGIGKNLTTHCARRTLASNSMELGMPIDITARILGHSSTNMTRRYYVKISDKKIRSEMEKLGERMG